jgi:hypothetical protein
MLPLTAGSLFVCFLALIGCATLTACLASGKGREPFGWWLYGFTVPLVALLHAAVMQPTVEVQTRRALATGTLVRCRECAEYIRPEAQRCRHCGVLQ